MIKKLWILLILPAFAFATGLEQLSDMAPNIDTTPLPQTDVMWDLQFNYATQTACNDNQLLGACFDGTYFWVTGGGNAVDPNKLYKLSSTGALLNTYNQTGTTGWGWRDLCWDGTYLYGSADAVGGSFTIRVLDPLATNPGNPISLITVTGQGTNFARALAWDPVSDHFYTGNFGSNIMEITRTGTVIRSVAPPTGTSGIYGMAWDDDGPGQPWLWVYDQVGTPQATFKKFNPVTLTFTYSYTPPLLAPNTAQISGGCEYTTQWSPQYSTMVVMTQGTPLDRMGGYEMYVIGPPPPPPNINLTLTPVNPPIVIPAAGGTFSYIVSVQNLDPTACTFGIWNMVTLPAGTNFGPVWGPFSNIPLAANQTIERTRTQGIPATAPSGVYTYRSYVGIYPSTVWDSASFTFTKSATFDGGKIVTEWSNWGETFPGENTVVLDFPSSYSLNMAYPNPFNPSANIGFTVPERALVKLTVYDVTGVEVSTLVNGWMEAGTHTAVFDGSGLASGVYFYRLTAGDFQAVNKMMLVK